MQDLRDHLTGALDDDHIPLADVAFGDIVRVVEGGIADRHAADAHRLQVGGWRQAAGPANIDDDALQSCHCFRGRILVGDGPAWSIADGPQPLLRGKIVDLDDQTIRLKVQGLPHCFPAHRIRYQLLKLGETPVLVAYGEAKLSKIIQCLPLAAERRAAVEIHDLVAQQA